MKILILSSESTANLTIIGKLYDIASLQVVFSKRTTITPYGQIQNQLQKLYKQIKNFTVEKAFSTSRQTIEKYFSKEVCNVDEYPTYYVDDINCKTTEYISEKYSPDLVIVLNSDFIKPALVNFLNKQCDTLVLHNGLAPYFRGEPNCTYFCLALGEFHLIGNTIMELHKTLHAGDVIYSKTTALNGSENLAQMNIKVLEQAHSMLYETVYMYINRKQLARTPQNNLCSFSQTFYKKDWSWKMIKLAKNNYATNFNTNHLSSAEFISSKKNIKCLELKEV